MASPGAQRVRTDVTVVIPTRNRRRLLLDAVESVRAQQGIAPVVVVVDDGGVDDTREVVSGLQGVRYVRHERSQGVSRARNRGLAEAQTRYVAFLDDDDLYEPSKLSKQIAAMEAHRGARWSFSGALHFDDGLVPFLAAPPRRDPPSVEAMVDSNLVPGGGSGVVVETELAKAVGGYDEKLSILADWDFYTRLRTESVPAVVHEALTGYFVHSDSMFHDPVGIYHELMKLAAKNPTFDPYSGRWLYRVVRMGLGLRRYRETLRVAMWLARPPRSWAGTGRFLSGAIANRLFRSERRVDMPDTSGAWLSRYESRQGR